MAFSRLAAPVTQRPSPALCLLSCHSACHIQEEEHGRGSPDGSVEGSGEHARQSVVTLPFLDNTVCCTGHHVIPTSVPIEPVIVPPVISGGECPPLCCVPRTPEG